MNKVLFLLVGLSCFLFASNNSMAAPVYGGYPCNLGLTAKDVAVNLKRNNIDFLSVYETPICGVFQVVLRDKINRQHAVRYITGDGRLFFSMKDGGADGQIHLFEVSDNGKVVDWTDSALIKSDPFHYLNANNAIVEGNKDAPVIAVFSDPGCVHCLNLARRLRPYIKSGKLRVMTFLYPIRGTFNDVQKIWCSKNKTKAWNDYVDGKWDFETDIKDCKTPSAENLSFGRKIGIRMTPTIIIPNGQTIAGEPENMDTLLSLAASQKNVLHNNTDKMKERKKR
ncbi:MAG: DsbC family protein [Methanobacteriota archaeon]|nr:MAG: DsbC family protein [Euryarchaeota archaeon]